MNLDEVIDWDIVEDLLNQKDEFDLGRAGDLRISCSRIIKDGLFKWLVYIDAQEHTMWEGGESVTHYTGLAEALNVGLHPSKHEEWEAMAKIKTETT